MFYIPALVYAYSSNLGDTITHSRRVVDYVRTTWPFFNRFARVCISKGAASAPLSRALLLCVHFHMRALTTARAAFAAACGAGPRASTTFCG